MRPIPESYLPERIDPATLPGWLGWSLPFFSEPVLQNPHIDLTLQLDVSTAFAQYQGLSQDSEQASFFAFLVWHLAQTLAQHPSFNLRHVQGDWYVLRNPPIFIPVAVGGDVRFRDLVLENVYRQDWPTFLQNYQNLLALARSPEGLPPCASEAYGLAHFMGNLPGRPIAGAEQFLFWPALRRRWAHADSAGGADAPQLHRSLCSQWADRRLPAALCTTGGLKSPRFLGARNFKKNRPLTLIGQASAAIIFDIPKAHHSAKKLTLLGHP